MRLGFRALPVLVLAFGAGLTAIAGAAHHVFHITNNASQRITSITMVYHMPDGSTVQQSYNLSIPLRVIKDVAIPHSVSTSGSTVDTTDVCNIDVAISYYNGAAVWLRGENLCSKPNIEARDTYASDFYNAQYATPMPDITPQPTTAPATAAPAPLATPRTPSEEAVHRGSQFFDKGNFSAAIPYFNSAIKLNSRSQIAYAYRSRTYFLMNQFQRSLNDADAGLRIDLNYPLLHWIRGNTEWAMGLNDSAIEDYAATATEYPDIKAYMTVLSVLVARESGDGAQAKSLLAACGSCKGDAGTNRVLQYLRGEITARDVVNLASTMDQRVDAHAAVGFTLLWEGKKAQARPHFQWILQKSDPVFNFRPIVRVRLSKMR